MAKPFKRPGDVYFFRVNFAVWPMNAGETLVASNTRGALGVTAADSAGTDLTAAMVEQVTIDGTTVKWLLKGGATGQRVAFTVTAPTSDGELLTAVEVIEVR